MKMKMDNISKITPTGTKMLISLSNLAGSPDTKKEIKIQKNEDMNKIKATIVI